MLYIEVLSIKSSKRAKVATYVEVRSKFVWREIDGRYTLRFPSIPTRMCNDIHAREGIVLSIFLYFCISLLN